MQHQHKAGFVAEDPPLEPLFHDYSHISKRSTHIRLCIKQFLLSQPMQPTFWNPNALPLIAWLIVTKLWQQKARQFLEESMIQDPLSKGHYCR